MTLLLLSRFSRSMLAEKGLKAEIQEVSPLRAAKLMRQASGIQAVMPDCRLAEAVEDQFGEEVSFSGPGFVQLHKGQKALVIERRVRDNVPVLEFVSITVKSGDSLWSRLGLVA